MRVAVRRCDITKGGQPGRPERLQTLRSFDRLLASLMLLAPESLVVKGRLSTRRLAAAPIAAESGSGPRLEARLAGRLSRRHPVQHLI